MKKYVYKSTILLLCAVLICLSGCTGLYEDLNRDPNQVTDEQMNKKNYKAGTNNLLLQGLVVPVEEHMYQFLFSLTGCPFARYIGAIVDSWLQKTETLNPSPDWRGWPFSNVLTETYTPYNDIINGTDDEVAHAFANVSRISIMQQMTDNYGPIPYSKLLNNKSIYVEYDSQEQVYTKMFEELDEVIEIFRVNSANDPEGWKNYDAVYYGNISQWYKFANSLKLRMAIRLTYVKPDLARAKAAEAIAAGIITANADNAAMHAAENRTTLIYNDWKDHRVGADILCFMNGYKDPRISKMFLPNDKGNYVGVRVGIDIGSKAQASVRYSNLIVDSSTPYMWMNAAEVTFLHAEYELRWGSPEQAKALYAQAIKLSFEQWGASGADSYVADAEKRKPASYTDPLGKYSVSTPASAITVGWEDDTTAEATERNLERIITQKWIAIFPLGPEAWAEYRRTGYPRLLPIVEDKSGGTVDIAQGPRRLMYPVEEYQKNNANLQAAIQMLNTETQRSRKGDTMGTSVWWDCKPYNN